MDSARRGLLIKKKMWLTKEGELIKVSKMTNQHLANTLRFLKRKWIPLSQFSEMYPPPQGEMAMMAWEQECDRLFEAELSGQIGTFEDDYAHQVLLKEAKKRKLDWELFDQTMEHFQCRSEATTSMALRHTSSGVQLKNLLLKALVSLLRSRL